MSQKRNSSTGRERESMDQAFETTAWTEGRARLWEMRERRRVMVLPEELDGEETDCDEGLAWSGLAVEVERLAAMLAAEEAPAVRTEGGEIWGPGSK